MADYNSTFTGAQIDAGITSANSAVQPGDDASTLGSGAAADGLVLTSDGLGGTAWEAGGGDDYVRTRSGTVQDLFDMAETWNDGATTFTSIKMNVTNTASASGSLLMDLQVGGSSKFSVRKDGTAFAGAVGSATGGLNILAFNSVRFGFGTGGAGSNAIQLRSDGSISFGAGNSIGGAIDLLLARDAANTFAQRNGTNGQTFNLYGTYTDASNLRRLVLTMSGAGVAEIKPDGLGTGSSGNVLHISGLPTSNPGPGILWNDAGAVKVGT